MAKGVVDRLAQRLGEILWRLPTYELLAELATLWRAGDRLLRQVI